MLQYKALLEKDGRHTITPQDLRWCASFQAITSLQRRAGNAAGRRAGGHYPLVQMSDAVTPTAPHCTTPLLRLPLPRTTGGTRIFGIPFWRPRGLGSTRVEDHCTRLTLPPTACSVGALLWAGRAKGLRQGSLFDADADDGYSTWRACRRTRQEDHTRAGMQWRQVGGP